MGLTIAAHGVVLLRPARCANQRAMRSWETDAIAIAEAAGRRIADAWSRPRQIDFKGEVDLVTETDRAVEAFVVERLHAAFPEHRIVAEEGDAGERDRPAEDTSWTWYVDPLDGTTNFAHGYPHVAVSLGVAHGNDLHVGVVHDPLRGETFSATRGEGARLNGQPLRVSSTAEIGGALLATGFPYDRRRHADAYLRFVADLMKCAQGIRREGSAALDLAWVAAGRLDGFWELKLKPWDVAAGALLVEEAGGRVTDFSGAPFDPWAGQVLATNGRIHGAVAEILARRLAAESDLSA